MDPNIGDKLNKAFEAYRNASIEKDSAKRELQQKTEQFERYTQQLKRKIEEQEQLISELKAQLSSAAQRASGQVKCGEVAHRKQQTERLSPNDPWPASPRPCPRSNHPGDEEMQCAPLVVPASPAGRGMKTEDLLDTLQELQGTFQRIQTLARRQKDHLKRIHRGNETANGETADEVIDERPVLPGTLTLLCAVVHAPADQQFSMPIQCTDGAPEPAEVPFSSSSKPEVNDCLTSGALASRGVSPEDANFMDDVKFPPSTESEYEFLNSTPDRTVPLVLPRKGPVEPISTGTEGSFPYPASPSASPQLPVSTSHEGVRGPQQPLWSPDLSTMASEVSSMESSQAASPGPCAFCQATIPQDLLYSHLNSHFQG